MDKNFFTLVVSRALSVTFLVSAIAEFSYLPERIYSANRDFPQSVLSSDHFWRNYHELTLALLVIRILGYSILGYIFWKCGPSVTKLLANGIEQSGQP